MDTNEGDLAANLKNYEIQLQQVLVALESDPSNEELTKLKSDLEEVISLTKQLVGGGGEEEDETEQSRPQYRPGQRVLAPWSEDGLYYEAKLEDVTSDGQCTVMFSSSVLPVTTTTSSDRSNDRKNKSVSEVCLTSLLKPLSQGSQASSSHSKGRWDSKNPKSSLGNKSLGNKSSLGREAAKKKQQKRQDKLKELEEEREKDKMKWQSFASGGFKSKNKVKKGLATITGSKPRISIFASPDSVDGRVGVGTCGISGKPMTPYANTSTVGAAAVAPAHKKKSTLSSGFPAGSSQ